MVLFKFPIKLNINLICLWNVDALEDLVRDEKRAKFCPTFDTIQVNASVSNDYTFVFQLLKQAVQYKNKKSL